MKIINTFQFEPLSQQKEKNKNKNHALLTNPNNLFTPIVNAWYAMHLSKIKMPIFIAKGTAYVDISGRF